MPSSGHSKHSHLKEERRTRDTQARVSMDKSAGLIGGWQSCSQWVCHACLKANCGCQSRCDWQSAVNWPPKVLWICNHCRRMHPTELHNCSCGQSQFASEAASLVYSCTSEKNLLVFVVAEEEAESRQSEPYFRSDRSETNRFSNTRELSLF
jgi:hypothetical protein